MSPRPQPSRPSRFRLAGLPLLLAAVLALAAGACATNFRTMQKPAPGATAPTTVSSVVTTTQAAIQTAPPALFLLTSSGFEAGAVIPTTYTCDGAGTSPPMSWSNVPAGTAELVLAITDPQAGNAIQWFVAGIAPSTPSVAAGATPAGAVVLANSKGAHAYEPLCPPAGEDHTFEFTLYALAKPSGLTAASDPTKALTQVSNAAGGNSAVLTGDYQRP